MKIMCENCGAEVDEVLECEICEQEVCDNCMVNCEKFDIVFCSHECRDCDNCDERHNCGQF
jgi:hypothetical protein